MKAGEGLTGRYCLLQGSYYGVNCAVIGYASVFLLERGMSPAGIGALIAAGNVLSAVLQPMAAGIADRSGRVTLKQMIRLAAAAGAILSLLVGVFGSLKLIAPLYMALAMIANLEMPLVNAVSVYFSNRGYRINFGLARGIGSLTYAAFSYGLGLLAGMFGAGLIPWASMALYVAVFACCGLFSMKPGTTKVEEQAGGGGNAAAVQDGGAGLIAAPHDGAAGPMAAPGDRPAAPADATASCAPCAAHPRRREPNFFSRYRTFTLTLAGVVMLFAFHNITCTYMIRMMERFGGGSEEMGLALAVAAVCELPTMLLFSRLARSFRVSTLLAASAAGFVVKSLLLLAAWDVNMILAAQVFQAFSFALFIPASVAFTDQVMKTGDKIKGQAYMTAASTLGSVAGNLSGGIVLDASGVSAMLVLACAFALGGLLTVGAAAAGERLK